MAVNTEDIQALYDCFVNALSGESNTRRRAESMLAEFNTKPLYSLTVLHIVADRNFAKHIRLAASVNFKNHLRSRWVSDIDKDEKHDIKALTVSLMLNGVTASPEIQIQLSEALVFIGKHDFLRLWPSLLPQLIQSLQTHSQAGNYASVNGILGIANSIFNKFRHEYKTNDLLHDISNNFGPALLEIFRKTASLIESAAHAGGDAAALKPLFVSQRLCCSIFFSLNYHELHEFFKDHMKEWMNEQQKYLTNSYPALESNAEGVALVDELRAAVCENFSLHLEKNEKEFQPYFYLSEGAVWNLLKTVSQASSRDQLAVTAIKFLITVSTGVKHKKLTDDGVIQQIFVDIVIPNVRLRDEDVELFNLNYIEFIRREGSDINTRRWIACELLKQIATYHTQVVTNLVSVQIQNLLDSFAQNPADNWKDKDIAIYLVVSLATKRAGGTSSPIDLPVGNFFLKVIVPELQSQDINESPILKAAALNFFTTFRNQLLKTTAIQYFDYFPDFIRFLCAESNVVHSYAASCIEKLLLAKDEGGQARYTSVDISPLLPQLMTNLFEALKVPKSEENQYLMKCIMRVFVVADISLDIVSPRCLTRILNKACENPRNPLFNHYVFECVAVLVKRASAKDFQIDASLIEYFRREFYPIIQKILVEKVQEFYPYAFQLKAQLVELSKPPFPRCYWEVLVAPTMWEKASNASALVLLLQAFLQKDELNREMLTRVITISCRLVSKQRTVEQGFYMLNTIIKCLDFNVIAPYISQIRTALIPELNTSQRGKFIKCLLILMSLVLVKHGCANLVDSVNGAYAVVYGIQSNLFLMVLGKYWIHHLTNITGVIETKLTAVASTRLLCESQMLLDDAAVEQWGLLLNSIVTLLSRTEQERVEEDPVSSIEQERVEEDPEILMPEFSENFVYSATFVRLHHAGKTEDDPLKDIRDAKELLVTSLARLSALSPGRYPQIISQYVEPTNQAELLRLCNSYNCQII